MKTSQKNLTKMLCINAVMVALYVVLEYVSVRIGNNLKITFNGLPIIISAIFFGPLAGAFTGGLGSFISQMLQFGFSPTTVLWILPAIARGLTVGILYKYCRKKYLSLYIVLSSLIVSALNTLTLYVDGKLYHYYNPATFLTATAFRFASGIITAVVYIAVIYAIMKPLEKVIKTRQ